MAGFRFNAFRETRGLGLSRQSFRCDLGAAIASLSPRYGLTGVVKAVSRSPIHSLMKKNEERILLIAGLGVDGDTHQGATVKHSLHRLRFGKQPNWRQVHLIHAELHAELRERGFNIAPGQMGENVTTKGLDLLSLPRGTRLRLGPDALVQLTGLRSPCTQVEQDPTGPDDGNVGPRRGREPGSQSRSHFNRHRRRLGATRRSYRGGVAASTASPALAGVAGHLIGRVSGRRGDAGKETQTPNGKAGNCATFGRLRTDAVGKMTAGHGNRPVSSSVCQALPHPCRE
jgi:hypothetical protein